MKPKVSVIIPVYNAEAYLPECVRALCGQTLKEMEFLFVDDGSADGSLGILEEARRTDARIRIIPFPENRGVSAARNAGIQAAEGEFIGFCDADDTVEPEMYEALLGACQAADISFCRVFKDRPWGSENVPLGFADGTRFDGEAIRNDLIPAMLALPKDGDGLPLSGYTPRNLFARNVIGEHRFREDIRYAEDLLFIVTCLLDAKSAVAVDRAYYHYRFHEGSVTKRFSPYIPDSFDRSNTALTELIADNGKCMERMQIRGRKMAVDVVRNFCCPGTPHPFLKRVRLTKAYMQREDVRELFRDLSLSGLPVRTAVRLGLMKYRMPLVSCLLYSTVFRSRM